MRRHPSAKCVCVCFVCVCVCVCVCVFALLVLRLPDTGCPANSAALELGLRSEHDPTPQPYPGKPVPIYYRPVPPPAPALYPAEQLQPQQQSSAVALVSCCGRRPRRRPATPPTLAPPKPAGLLISAARAAPPREPLVAAEAAAMRRKYRFGSDTPEEIGHSYIVTGQVGSGAYGKVYKAEQPGLAAPVAIKVVDGIFNSTTDAKRTLRELSILRQCDHPNVIKCHAVLSPPTEWRRRFSNLWIVRLHTTPIPCLPLRFRGPNCRLLNLPGDRRCWS